MDKKILVINAHDINTGAGRSCLSTLQLLSKQGCQIVHVARFNGQIENHLEKIGIKTIYCDFPGWFPQMNSNGKKMNIIQRLRSILHSLRVNHSSLKIVCGQLKKMNFTPDLIYTNTILWYMGLFLSRKYKCPHYYHIREYGMDDFGMYFVLGRKMSSLLANIYTKKAFCISKGVQAAWKDFFGDKAILMYNGISVPKIAYCEHHYCRESFRIILVGRLSIEKGQRSVITQLPQIISKSSQNIVLDLYGTGSDENNLKQLVSDLSLNGIVNFCGFSENIDYSKYHLAVMSSKSEGFGRTTIEYMFNSVPVVGYKDGATPELIEDGLTGKLYSNDVEFVDIVCEAIANYSKFADYAKNAFANAVDHFSLDAYRENILKEFRN